MKKIITHEKKRLDIKGILKHPWMCDIKIRRRVDDLKDKIEKKSDASTESTSIKRTLSDDEDTVGFEFPQVLNNDAKKCKRVSFNLL